MSESADYIIGSEVGARDGVCGDLRRVIINPVARSLTHLVVEPKHRRGMGHLVPIELVEPNVDGICLRCTIAEFGELEDAEETQYVGGAPGEWSYGQEEMLSHPYYTFGGGMGMGIMSTGPQAITVDHVPMGEVQVRRGEHVHAKDGVIGKVQGLVVDSSGQHVTHVLLDEGHLWGKKRVAIPIRSVDSVDHGVQLALTKDQIRDLPPVDLGRAA